MKTTILILISFIFPYLSVWMAYFLTAFNFDIHQTFSSELFVVYCVVYYTILISFLLFICFEYSCNN